MRLNLGCGRDIRPGWVNIDQHLAPGVDLVVDLDSDPYLPYDDDSVDEFRGAHVIEHLHRPLPLMQELWRVARPGASASFRCPYGSSDDADEDPTHVRRMFLQSWLYFGQPAYWRADYGYRGDWQIQRITLVVSGPPAELSDAELSVALRYQRNVVDEMVADLVAVKPARPPDRSLQQRPEIVFHREGAHHGG